MVFQFAIWAQWDDLHSYTFIDIFPYEVVFILNYWMPITLDLQIFSILFDKTNKVGLL